MLPCRPAVYSTLAVPCRVTPEVVRGAASSAKPEPPAHGGRPAADTAAGRDAVGMRTTTPDRSCDRVRPTTRKQRRAPLPGQENDDPKLNRKRVPSASSMTCSMKFLNNGSNPLRIPGAEETSQKIKYGYGNYDDYLHTGPKSPW